MKHIPLAKEFGMGMVPWSPLAFGLLAGKYNRATVENTGPRVAGLPREAAADGESRPGGDKRLDGANPFGDSLFTDRNWAIVDVLRQVASQIGETPARIALAWVISRAGIVSTLMGVSSVKQLTDNVGALSVTLSSEHLATLNSITQGEQRITLQPLYASASPARRVWECRSLLVNRFQSVFNGFFESILAQEGRATQLVALGDRRLHCHGARQSAEKPIVVILFGHA
jgi:diketogulonate reductase-like aldo/keto reductase